MSTESRNQPLALAVRILLELGDGRQGTLAERSGIAQRTLRRYENGEARPHLKALSTLASAAELPVPLPEFLAWCEKLTAKKAALGGRPPRRVSGGLLAAAAKLAAAAAAKGPLTSPSAVDRQGAAESAGRLLASGAEERSWLIEETLEYRNWAVAEAICQESRRSATHEPKEALGLAELALAIAELTPGEMAWSWRVQGYALCTVANAWRVAGHLPEAREKWDEGKRLWQAGAAADPGLLDEIQIQSLEVSLLTSERRYREALTLADAALENAGGEQVVDLLIQKANVLELLGEYRAAIVLLRRVEARLGEASEPRKICLHRYALMNNLCFLREAQEAARFLPEATRLAGMLGNAVDQIRFKGLEGRIAAGLGDWEEAACLFSESRRGLETHGMLYDAALVSLELATVYLEMGRTEEVKGLAAGLVPVFEQQGVSEEARKALVLFCQAVEQEIATAELARQVVAFLYRAQHNSALRFEDPL